jgi:hypothetical protein
MMTMTTMMMMQNFFKPAVMTGVETIGINNIGLLTNLILEGGKSRSIVG